MLSWKSLGPTKHLVSIGFCVKCEVWSDIWPACIRHSLHVTDMPSCMNICIILYHMDPKEATVTSAKNILTVTRRSVAPGWDGCTCMSICVTIGHMVTGRLLQEKRSQRSTIRSLLSISGLI